MLISSDTLNSKISDENIIDNINDLYTISVRKWLCISGSIKFNSIIKLKIRIAFRVFRENGCILKNKNIKKYLILLSRKTEIAAAKAAPAIPYIGIKNMFRPIVIKQSRG